MNVAPLAALLVPLALVAACERHGSSSSGAVPAASSAAASIYLKYGGEIPGEAQDAGSSPKVFVARPPATVNVQPR